MLLAMAQDIRVVLIKLADRLHNMRTLYGLPSEKQQRIARQTMEIYAPLAERLGIWQIKWELEDLAFKALEPERFRELAKLLDTRRKARETLHRARDRRAPAQARGGRHRGRHRGPAEAHLQHLEEDAAQERGVRRDLRRLRHPPARRRRRATATRPSASSTRSGGRSRASSTTTSRSPRTTSTSRSTPRSSRSTASRSRSRSGPTRCTRCPRSASPPTGATRKAPSPTASTTRSSPGSASSWTGSATSPSRRDRVRRGHQARHLPGPGLRVHARRATSRTCRPARRRSTSPTASTPTSATGRSAPRSTTASCRSTTG